MVDVVEHIGRRLVDWGRARACGRVGRGAGVDRARLEAVSEVLRWGRAAFRAPRERRRRWAVLDDAAVDAAPREFAAEPSELDLRAAVHDHFEARDLGCLRRLVVADAKLHPHDLGADGDRIVDNSRRRGRIAEEVDHVDMIRNVAQRGVNGLAEQGLAGEARIDRDHPIAFALQVLHHEVARAVPVGGGADQRDRPHPLEDRADFCVGIRDGFEAGHEFALSVKDAPSSANGGVLQRKACASHPLFRDFQLDHTGDGG